MYLTADELKNTYYPKAASMVEGEVKLYLARANSYALGIIGGKPAFTDQLPEEQLKAAVAMAFELFSQGETATVNSVNGNITEAAPAGYFQRPPSKQYEPFKAVDVMLAPYAALFDRQNAVQSEKGVSFL
ncbi:hypothetical protein ACF5W4_11130 [Bacillota bacterium Lsc_1132]